MSEKAPVTESKPVSADAPPAATPPRRSPGHRGQDVRDTVAEMAARAHEISLEAGSKMSGYPAMPHERNTEAFAFLMRNKRFTKAIKDAIAAL